MGDVKRIVPIELGFDDIAGLWQRQVFELETRGCPLPLIAASMSHVAAAVAARAPDKAAALRALEFAATAVTAASEVLAEREDTPAAPVVPLRP